MKDLTNLEVRDYLGVLWKRRWYCLAVFVLVATGAAVYAWIVPNVYKSEARIMVNEPLVSEDYVRPTVRWTPEDRINSIRERLASRTFLADMIERNPGYSIGNDGLEIENAIKDFQRQIGIEKTSSNTFTISFVATDPGFAQKFTKQLSEELRNFGNTSKKKKVLATDDFIVEQLRQCSADLQKQDDEIKGFKMKHLGELPEQGDANLNALSGLYSQQSATENAIQQAQERQKMLDFKIQERRRLNLLSQSLAATESAMRTGENKGNPPSPARVELAAKRELLSQYLAKYTPNHPDVVTLRKDIDRLEQEVARQRPAGTPDLTPLESSGTPGTQKEQAGEQGDPMEASFRFEAEGIKTEIAKREKEKQEIQAQKETYNGKLKLAPALEQRLKALLREKNVLEARYDNLQKQKFSTQMAKTVEDIKDNESYQIIDEANLPAKPQSPKQWHIVLMGIAGGLAMGIGAAFGREMLDTTIGGEEEAKNVLNLPVLVTIQTVPKEKKNKKRVA